MLSGLQPSVLFTGLPTELPPVSILQVVRCKVFLSQGSPVRHRGPLSRRSPEQFRREVEPFHISASRNSCGDLSLPLRVNRQLKNSPKVRRLSVERGQAEGKPLSFRLSRCPGIKGPEPGLPGRVSSHYQQGPRLEQQMAFEQTV